MTYELAKISVGIALRESIVQLEQELLRMPQAEMPVEHHFADGLYGRVLHIPKHCCLTGAIHKREHINILAKGDITVITEDGPKRITAPYVMVSMPGTKRAGFAHEDCVWITVHACDETTVEGAETALVTNDYEEWLRLEACPLQLPEQS